MSVGVSVVIISQALSVLLTLTWMRATPGSFIDIFVFESLLSTLLNASGFPRREKWSDSTFSASFQMINLSVFPSRSMIRSAG